MEKEKHKYFDLVIFVFGIIFVLIDTIFKSKVIQEGNFVKNFGVSFGLNINNIIIILINIIFIIILTIIRIKTKSQIIEIGLYLIIIGTIFNVFDRIVYGFVIDYLPFFFGLKNNLADYMIGLGFALFIYNYYKEYWIMGYHFVYNHPLYPGSKEEKKK